MNYNDIKIGDKVIATCSKDYDPSGEVIVDIMDPKRYVTQENFEYYVEEEMVLTKWNNGLMWWIQAKHLKKI
jgi:hypothetical protein